MATATITDTALHPFEKAGLGKAPYRYMGFEVKECSGQPDDKGLSVGYAGQPAGCCDYCGNGIKYCCKIRSADGREFVVGTDCVLKLERHDNALYSAATKIKKQLARDAAAARRAKKVAQERERIAAARDILHNSEHVRGVLNGQPHPSIEGRTALDYCLWLDRNAGQSGLVRMAALVEKTAYPPAPNGAQLNKVPGIRREKNDAKHANRIDRGRWQDHLPGSLDQHLRI